MHSRTTNILRPLQIKFMILFAILVSFSTHLLAEEPYTVFKSSFSDGVHYNTSDGGYHHITGTDSVSGYTWPNDLPGRHFNDPDGRRTDNVFNYLVAPQNMDNYTDFVETRIESVTGPFGTPVNALYQRYKANDPDAASTSRTQLSIDSRKPETGLAKDGELDELYFKFYIKQHHLRGGSAHNLMFEMKTFGPNGVDYRWGVYIYDIADGKTPYWYMKGEDYSNWGVPQWPKMNKTVPVPEDEWYKFELYVKHSTGSDGFLRVAINDKVIMEHFGSTLKNYPVDALWPLKMYGSKGWMWTTDFEIWNKPPSASVLSQEYIAGSSSAPTPKDGFIIRQGTPETPGVLERK